MSHLASGVLGTVAGVLALGAVHLEVAAGNDLLGPVQRGDASLAARNATQLAVNREAKSDRAGLAPSAEGVTISFRLPGQADTSVMMRMPFSTAQADKRPAQPTADNTNAKPKIACEASVSLLTAIARQLQPGRCIT